jgi:SAM-dependent methyltransferase
MSSESKQVDLPYFDQLLEQLARAPDSKVSKTMSRHVHWGYFGSPVSDASVTSCVSAAEAMTERVCRAARVADGLRILDVGCGFGGTVAFLNEHLSGCELVGLNIDERQLARARQLVSPRAGNRVSFVQADAVALPFDDGAFDVVLAVECIFHFSSRKTFFNEARRVLRPGGTLALSDFIVNGDKIDEMAEWTAANAGNNFFGVKTAALCTGTYPRLARVAGFTVLSDEDVTANTMPTYVGLRNIYGEAEMHDGVAAAAYLEELSRRGFFEYRILSFEAKAG